MTAATSHQIVFIGGSPRGLVKLAMSIGGENRVGRLRRGNIQRFAETMRLDEAMLFDLIQNIADAIIAALPRLEREADAILQADELLPRLIPPIRELCEKTLETMAPPTLR